MPAPTNFFELIEHEHFDAESARVAVAHMRQLVIETLKENKKTGKFPKTRIELTECIEKHISVITRSTSKSLRFATAIRIALCLDVPVEWVMPSGVDWLCNVWIRLNPDMEDEEIFKQVKEHLGDV